MEEGPEKKPLSRRDFLKGIAVAGAAAAVGGAATEKAQAQDLPSGYDRLVKGAMKLHGIDAESFEKKTVFETLDKTKEKIVEQGRVPKDYEYKQSLGSAFGIDDWSSEKGERFQKFLEEWKESQ